MAAKARGLPISIQKKFLKNRCGLTESELKPLLDFEFFTSEMFKYWIKAEPVSSKRCAACHYEGRPLYFNPLGLLIRRKCPPWICAHALAQLSPVLYGFLDLPFDEKRTERMLFRHIICTDPGLGRGGMGSVIFRLTREKMPLLERLRFLFTLLFSRPNKRVIGEERAVKEAAVSGGPEPDNFMKSLPLDDRSLESFLASPTRVTRLRAIEKFKDYRIVVHVVSSDACIAGHKQGDAFFIDSMGKVLPAENGNGICLMALNKLWYRVILALERMAGAVENESAINSTWYKGHISCFGAGLPLGACGQVMMTIEICKV